MSVREDAAWWYAFGALIEHAGGAPVPGSMYGHSDGDGTLRVTFETDRGKFVGQLPIEEVMGAAEQLTDAEIAHYLEAQHEGKAAWFDAVIAQAAPLMATARAPLEGKAKKFDDNVRRARQLEAEGLSDRAIARQMLQEGKIKSTKEVDDPARLDNARRSVRRWLSVE